MTIKSFLSWGFLSISLGLNAQQKDTLIVYQDLQEVHINALRATPQTPMSYSNIGAQQLDEQNLGQDIPYMLSLTPSVVTTSDAGACLLYTSPSPRDISGSRMPSSA